MVRRELVIDDEGRSGTSLRIREHAESNCDETNDCAGAAFECEIMDGDDSVTSVCISTDDAKAILDFMNAAKAAGWG
jgi:hypothetical protein